MGQRNCAQPSAAASIAEAAPASGQVLEKVRPRTSRALAVIDVADRMAAITAAQALGRRAHVARKLAGESRAKWSSVPRQVANSAGAIARALLRRRRKPTE